MDNYALGEIVDVRNYGRAEVIEPLVTDPNARFYGRIRIRYQCDGKTYYARPDNLRKTIQVQQRVLLCHSTTHYRTCAASLVNWDDTVLEVGSHEGECTFLLSRRCRYVLGVDKSHTTVEAARRRYPGLRFEAVDGFDVAALKALGPPDGSGFSVVLVDIGGIASLSTVAGLVGLYYKEFPYTTKIVVKSVFLKRMVENCLPYNTEKHNPWALLSSGGGSVEGGNRAAAPGGASGDGGAPGEHASGEGEGEDEGEEEEEPGPRRVGGGPGPACSRDSAEGCRADSCSGAVVDAAMEPRQGRVEAADRMAGGGVGVPVEGGDVADCGTGRRPDGLHV